MKRQRATVIVEIDGKILLVENRGGLILLPGGGINPQESRAQAAARELAEETCLLADSLQFLFSHESHTNCHHVFHTSVSGTPLAGDDAAALHYLDYGDPTLGGRMSAATQEIIERFLGSRDRNATALDQRTRHCEEA
ncbi:NUDIX domain-containing protein [Candidatus Accumulibacter sp. ACC003]|uniref:NUDIX domain-containing protein n=1 Tax=Candidatus Accumulibacter sp. ACC003 TaxID=2823334 RepID=UPI0025BF975F|nr:NUDIX domain-containing protein [Candidatus Accumulibacter sp. ACC003]